MNFGRFVSFPIFLIALAIGIFFVYISSSPEKNIYVYPTPENLDKFLWKDATGTCYGWEAKEVKKPEDSSKIKRIPVQN